MALSVFPVDCAFPSPLPLPPSPPPVAADGNPPSHALALAERATCEDRRVGGRLLRRRDALLRRLRQRRDRLRDALLRHLVARRVVRSVQDAEELLWHENVRGHVQKGRQQPGELRLVLLDRLADAIQLARRRDAEVGEPYTELYNDVDTRVELCANQVVVTEELVKLRKSGLLPVEVGMPRALRALGVAEEGVQRYVAAAVEREAKRKRISD